MKRSYLALAVFAAGAAIVAGCGGSGNSAPVSYTNLSGTNCSPPPLTAPPVALLYPVPGATNVPIETTTAYVNGFGGYITASAQISYVPSAAPTSTAVPEPLNSSTAAAVPASAATPQAGANYDYAIPLPTPLQPNTVYAVNVVGTQYAQCPQPFTSLAGTFTTGTL